MKATVKQLTTITFISLLLMVLNVRADGTETKAIASGNENIESALELENWMTNETIWKTDASIFFISPETETELALDEWMTNSKTWNTGFNFTEETESVLELEDWMTSDVTWNNNTAEKEPELKLESWMMDTNIWK